MLSAVSASRLSFPPGPRTLMPDASSPAHHLRIRISPRGDGPGYEVRVAGAGDVQELSERVPPLDCERLEREYLRPLRSFVEQAIPDRLLPALGCELGSRLLPPAARARLTRALTAEPRVRLQLRIEVPELADLPWEFACLEECPAEAGNGFLALHPQITFARRPLPAPGAGATPRPSPPALAGTLRVLVAWADPGSASYPALPQLRDEVRSVLLALRSSECRRVTAMELPYATPVSLQRALVDLAPHVLHFVGHGDTRPSGAVLVLDGERPGAEAAIYADELAGWLEASASRLVVLSACGSGPGARGIAEILTSRGVPAVLAMQLPLRDATAGLFARAFYAALVEPCPVDEAVSQARQAVRGAGPDWGVPALYLGMDSGDLFDRAAARPAPPCNLPYRHNPHFVGRAALLAALRRALQAPDGRPVALTGLGGLGKTQLAVEYAHACAADYPGGVFWVNARDSLRLQDDLAALGRYFGVPESLSARERAARVRDRLQQLTEPALLICDNVTDETDLLLPAGGACRILITARVRHVAPEGFHVLPVPALDDESALALLQVHHPAEGPGEREAAGEIAAMLGNLSLALAVAGHHVQRLGLTFAGYRDRLARNRVLVLEQARRRFITSTGHHDSIFDAIDLAQRSLLAPAPQVLAAAACFAGRGISPDLLFSASGLEDRDDFEEAAADLVDASLATRERDGRLTVHELVRVYARGEMSPPERQETLERVCAALAGPLRRANEAFEWSGVNRELAHCRAAAVLAGEGEPAHALAELLFQMGDYQLQHGDFRAAVSHLREGLRTARQLDGGADLGSARCLRLLGEAWQYLGEPKEALACVREALAIARAQLPADSPQLGDYFNDVGYVLKLQGRLGRALPYYARALAIQEGAHGRRHGSVALCLNNIGTLMEAKGDLESALRHLQEALVIDEALFGGAHRRVAIRLNNIGRVLSQQSAWEDALARHQQALAIFQGIGEEEVDDRRQVDVGMSLAYIGDAQAGLGERAAAEASYANALTNLERYRGTDHPLSQRVRSRLQAIMEEAS